MKHVLWFWLAVVAVGLLALSLMPAVQAQTAAPAAPAAVSPAPGVASVIWNFLNSAFGISCVAAAVLVALNKLYAKKPLWQQFEGTFISGVKMAEKAIADDSPNVNAQRVDHALKYIETVFEQVQKRRATTSEVAQMKDGISLVHDRLENQETL